MLEQVRLLPPSLQPPLPVLNPTWRPQAAVIGALVVSCMVGGVAIGWLKLPRGFCRAGGHAHHPNAHVCCPPTSPQLLTFVNTFLLLNDANRLAVFTAGAAGCQLAYCSPSCLPPAAAGPAAAAEAAWPPSASVLAGLQQALTSAAAAAAAAGAPPPAGTACQLSSALSRALCFLNSQQRRAAAAVPGGAPFPEGSDAGGGGAGLGPQAQAARVLVLAAAPDVPSQYISVMNAIFSAQVGPSFIFQPKGHSSAQRARLCSVVRAACRPPGRWGALCVLRCVPHPAWQALPCGGCSAVLGACRARALQPAPLALQGSLHHPPSGRLHTFPSSTRAAPAAVCPQAVCPQAAHPPWIILPAAE